jgi:hypothetical protein
MRYSGDALLWICLLANIVNFAVLRMYDRPAMKERNYSMLNMINYGQSEKLSLAYQLIADTTSPSSSNLDILAARS